jgi:hypothetical protein
VAIAAVVADAATNVTFVDFSNVSTLQLNGSTATYNNPVTSNGRKVLRLTSGLGQAGSVFLKEAIPLTDASGFRASFSTSFKFQITKPVGCIDADGVQGADGIVFVVQTVSNTAGAGGGGIGYFGLPRSVGIEFDTWRNSENGEENGNHVGIDLNGQLFPSFAQVAVTPAMNDGAVWQAWVEYNGQTQVVEVRLVRTVGATPPSRPVKPLLSASVDLPAILESPSAFVGFTSGTGCGGGDHDILEWQFTNAYDPVCLIN